MANKLAIGIFSLLISVVAFYIYFSGQTVKIDADKTSYYENGTLGEIEYSSLYNGSVKLKPFLVTKEILPLNGNVSFILVRTAHYGNLTKVPSGTQLIDVYLFDNGTTEHRVTILDAKGLIYEYKSRLYITNRSTEVAIQ